jgi:hypothetical protein
MQIPIQNTLTRILIATKATQGQRANDFSWTQEGEPVTFSSVCDGEEIDGDCGCRRSMTGLQSTLATTTVQVAYLPGGRNALQKEIHAYLERAGWSQLLGDEQTTQIVEADTEELVRIASCFPVRTVLEMRGNLFQVREHSV